LLVTLRRRQEESLACFKAPGCGCGDAIRADPPPAQARFEARRGARRRRELGVPLNLKISLRRLGEWRLFLGARRRSELAVILIFWMPLKIFD
jgi:hypothetical protein